MHEENDSKTYSSYQEYLDEQIKDGGALAYAQLLIESHVMQHVTPDPFGVSAEDVLWAVSCLLLLGDKPRGSQDNFYEVVSKGDCAVRAEWLDRALRFEMAGDSTFAIGYALLRSQEEFGLDVFVENMQREESEFRFVDGLEVISRRRNKNLYFRELEREIFEEQPL